MKRLPVFLFAWAAALPGGPAKAAVAQWQPPADCAHLEGAQWTSCLIAHAGAKSGTSLTADGRVFLQALSFDGVSGLLIQFERNTDGSLQLDIRDPGAAQPPYMAQMPGKAWDEIAAAWKKLLPDVVKANAAMKERALREKETSIVAICDRPSSIYIESNAAGSLISADANACDDPDEVEFGDVVAQLALDGAAPCGLLESRNYKSVQEQLEACLVMRGNKQSAALVLNALAVLDRFDADMPKSSLKAFLGVVAPSASLQVAGRSSVNGGGAVAKAWAASWAEAFDMRIELDAVRGTADEVTMDGSVRKTVKTGREMLFLRAPCHQRWRRQRDGSFKLESWTVGGFVKDTMP